MMTASCLLDEIDRKERIVQYSGGKIDENAIGITSERVGYVPGIHTVTIDGRADTIEITHTARSREGFASGAVKAAEWLGASEVIPMHYNTFDAIKVNIEDFERQIREIGKIPRVLKIKE